MAGMASEQFYAQLDDAERSVRQAQDKLARFRQLQPQLRELVGRYDSGDGYLHIEWSAAQGLSVLELNPRAMRLPSQDLAAAIKDGVRAAQADLNEQTRALLTEAGLGTGERPDFAQLEQHLQQLGDQTLTANRSAVEQIQHAQQQRRTLPF